MAGLEPSRKSLEHFQSCLTSHIEFWVEECFERSKYIFFISSKDL